MTTQWCVKNTFVEIVSSSEEESASGHSAPARLQESFQATPPKQVRRPSRESWPARGSKLITAEVGLRRMMLYKCLT